MKPLAQLTDDEFTALARRAVASPDAPAEWQQRALAAWQLAQAAAPGLPGWGVLAGQAAGAIGRRLAASLRFDSWSAAPLATGLRSLRTDTRQFIFNAEGRDIDLRLSTVAGRFVLTGQVLGPDESGTVELQLARAAEAAPEAVRRVPLDTLGEFHIDGVPAGRYVLTLTLGDEQIVLSPIDVGPVTGR